VHRPATLHHDEVDLPPVDVAEVAQLHVPALGVLDEVAHFRRCAPTRLSKRAGSSGTTDQSRW
jgi:hypothetical protein